MKFNRRFVYIAVVLFALSVPAGTWVFKQSFNVIDVSQLLVLLLIVASIALYSIGRNEFLKQTKRLQVTPILVLLFGAFIFFYGGLISLLSLDAVEFYLSYSSPLNESAILAGVLDFVWSSLWVLTGALLGVDWLRLQPKALERGVILAVMSSIALWKIALFQFYTGLFVSFLGYLIYQFALLALVLLTIMGLVMVVFQLKKTRRVLIVFE